jgi:hypothetical protein
VNEPIALVACHVTVMLEEHGKSHGRTIYRQGRKQ